MKERIIIGITGATGIQYGVRALELLRDKGVETHLVISRSAELVSERESGITLEYVHSLADVVHRADDIGASIASGSFKTRGMLIAPCTVKTLAEIANGIAGSLMTRAADVVLKERRRLVLMVRETPLHLGHLRNMVTVTEMGAVVMPPVPALYTNPKSIDDMITHSVARALDLFDIETDIPRWE